MKERDVAIEVLRETKRTLERRDQILKSEQRSIQVQHSQLDAVIANLQDCGPQQGLAERRKERVNDARNSKRVFDDTRRPYGIRFHPTS
jgi:hypothetical protein